MRLEFEKYHGLGNDFIVVEAPSAEAIAPAQAARLCDRHLGIGADGVLVLGPSTQADARLVILNADGSRPEMCGNGLRCVALHIERTRGSNGPIRVETDAGVLGCQLFDGGAGRWVTIELGTVRGLGHVWASGPHGAHRFERVATGNPHAVLLGHDYDLSEIDMLAPIVCGRIEGGANVEFVKPAGPQRICVVVWERGVGRTLACGTGAAAAAFAAARAGLVDGAQPVAVMLPGGELSVRLCSDAKVELSGPAVHVFGGSVPIFAEN